MSFHQVLKNALHPETCSRLVDFVNERVDNGEAQHDIQCPTSWRVSNWPMLDQTLEEFLPTMQQHTGKQLFPTYAYARLYQRGEILKCHLDRASCEYSATITLGYSANAWPIFIADPGDQMDQGIVGEEDQIHRVRNVNKVDLEVGDALIYTGCVSPHWRDRLDDDWQVQIFLHYVDQDGPHKEWKYDIRPCLAHHEAPTLDDECLYWYINDAISDSSCDAMIEKFESAVLEKATIGNGSTGHVDVRVRDVNKAAIPNEIGIGATLTGIGLNINSRSWKFDISRSNQSEYLMYDKDGQYLTHVDTRIAPQDNEVRKITVLAFLNDDFEGGSFYLENDYKRLYPPQEKGTVIAFPSFINHGVEPVTKGIRRSIVTWMVGPWFK